MFCAITGHVPQDPVVSTKSGHLYERRVIEKHIAETGTCPLSGEALTKDDLLAVKGPAKLNPRPASATSIPGLLNLFQTEWDALMLEQFQLRQAVQGLRKELSAALYQNDAACRVIARLMREKEEILAAGPPASAAKDTAEDEGRPAKRAKGPEGLSPEVVSEIVAHGDDLSKTRKARTKAAAESNHGPNSFSSRECTQFAVHTTSKGGILDLALGIGTVVASAGSDATVRVFDYAKEEVVATLKGHSKKVTSVFFAGDAVVSGSSDGLVKVWGVESGEAAVTMADNAGGVAALTKQPTDKYCVAAGTGGQWCFYDIASGSTLFKSPGTGGSEYTTARFHPDGFLLGCGKKGAAIEIWDVRSGKTAIPNPLSVDSAVLSMAFSENGYHLATSCETAVHVWDLRKLKVIHTIDVSGRGVPHAVAFDNGAQYLAVAADSVEIYASKKWDLLGELGGLPAKGALSVAFADKASPVVVGSGDHKLRLFSASA